MHSAVPGLGATTIIGVTFLLLSSACSEVVEPTAPLTSKKGPLSSVQESEHFYYSNGYYHWDGQPTPGDLEPAEIISAKACGRAPTWGTGGWICGQIVYAYADQHKIDLVYSMDNLSTGQPYYHNAQASSGWKFGLANDRVQNPARFERSLMFVEQCNYSLIVGGTAHARKAIPFGISISLIKFKVSVVPGNTSWGETSAPLEAFQDPGTQCDEPWPEPLCDNQETPEVEHCPIEGDPANSSPPSGGSDQVGYPNGSPNTGTPGSPPSGEFVCVYWTDWFVSFDGGQTWRYEGRECHEYAYNEQ